MLTSIQGIYRDGQIELIEKPSEVEDNTPVIVTFLSTKIAHISLAKRGINQQQAQALRFALSSFADEWDSAEMDIYDSYHKEAK
jgi:hypothetical protein